MTANRALIKSVTDQDSAQMTELPFKEGYAVTRIGSCFSGTNA